MSIAVNAAYLELKFVRPQVAIVFARMAILDQLVNNVSFFTIVILVDNEFWTNLQ